MTQGDDLLGKGAAFPLRLHHTSGALLDAKGARKVKDAIRMIVGTLPGERIMRPTFGCLLKSLMFEPNTAATASRAKVFVEDALTRWEPRIVLHQVRVSNLSDQGRSQLLVEVEYQLRTTRQWESTRFVLALET